MKVNEQFVQRALASDCKALKSIRLVIKVATQYLSRTGATIDLEDLVQAGMETLVMSKNKHKESQGPWGPFAVFCIRKGIRRALRNATLLRMPEAAEPKAAEIRDLSEKGMSVDDIAEKLNLKADSVWAAIINTNDAAEYFDETETNIRPYGCPSSMAEAIQAAERITSLPQRQREAVTGRAQGYTLAELGTLLNISTQAVQQNQQAGLTQLRKGYAT